MNNFAISSIGIGEALQRSAAALATAGNTLEESIGMIIAANNVVQNPEQVGTALKTLSMYLRAAKTEAEEAGISTDGMATSVSKLRDEILALTNNKLDIQIDEDTFKTPYQIIDELSLLWDDLTDITRANITNLFGGKRGANVLTGLIKNFDDARKAAETAMNSIGSATMENEKYLDSIAGKISQLKAAFEALANSVINSGLVSSVFSIATAFTNVLASLGKIHQLLPAITALERVYSGIRTASKNGTNIFEGIAGAFTKGSKALIIGEVVLGGILTLCDAIRRQSEEAIENAQKLTETYESAQKTYTSNIGTLKSLQDEFDDLSSRVGENGEQGRLTANEYERYLEIIDQITEISPTVIQGYDNEGKAILDYKNALSLAIEKQEEYLKNERAIYLGNGEEIFSGRIKEYKKEIGNFVGVIHEGFEDAIGGFTSGVGSQYEAFIKTVDEMGISRSGPLLEDENMFMRLFEKYDEFLNRLRATGKFTNEEIKTLELGFLRLSGTLSSLTRIAQQNATYLNTWAIDQTWYEDIPKAALASFRNMVAEVANATDDYTTQTARVAQIGTELASFFASDTATYMDKYAEGYKSGTVSADEYASKVKELSLNLTGNADVVAAIIDYYNSFTASTNEAATATDGFGSRVEIASDKLATALKELKSNYGVLATAQKEMAENGGISYDTIMNVAGSLQDGERLVDYLKEENGVLVLNTEAWEARSRAILENEVYELEDNISRMREQMTAYVDYTAEYEELVNKLNNGEISESEFDNSFAVQEYNRWETLKSRLVECEDELAVLQVTLKQVNQEKEEAFDPFDVSKMTTALDTLKKDTSGLFEFLEKVQSGVEITKEDILDLAKQYPELDWRLNFDNLNVEDTASAVSEMLDRADEQYSQIIDDQIALLEGLRAEAEVRGYDVDLLDTMIKNLRVMRGLSIVDLWGSKTTPATVDPMTQFANSLKTLKSASSMLQSMREYNSGKEKASFIGMLQSVVDLANSDDLKDAGLNITDFIDMTTGAFKEVGAEKWIDALVNQLRALKDANNQQLIPDALIEQLRLEALAAEEAEAAMFRLKTAHENVSAVIDTGNAISRNGQLTLSTFEQLIAVDSRYAYAVDYVNGKLTLNRDIFNQLTDSIMQETAAQADAEAMAIIMSDEYQQLAANIDNLSDKERSRLDDLNAEIMTYKVMANEIANATTARERFMNYSEGKSGYEGAQDALSVIQDVLENTKSSIYGQIGSDKFRLAADFVIGENVEVNTPEFEKAMKTIERYVTEDGQGILNFYNDLVSNGIVDATTGAMNTTIAEISEKLGISTEAARAFMEQLEKYQTQKFDWSALDPEQESKSAEDSLKKVKEAIEDVDKTVSDFKTNASEINIDPAPAVEAAGKISTALQGVIDKLLSIASNSKINVEINTTETTTTKTNTASGGIGGFFSSLFGRSAAGGTIGAAGGRTLVGELGPELTVDPKNGTWRVVGAKGPEFVNLPAGSIVIDAKQTAAAFKNMSPSGKGKSMASGTASAILNGVIAIGGTLLGKLLSGKTSTATTSTVAATTTSNVSGNTVAKPKVSSSKKSSGSSSSTAKATESVTKAVEKQKTAYELLNEQIEHLIEHQEQLYKEADRAFDYTGMQRSLEEQARLYQKMMENSYAAVEDMKRQGKTDTDEELQDMERKAWEAWENMYDTYDKIRALRVDALNDKIDDLQKGYANLQTIADQMSKNGGISVDAFQALTDHGLQYLSMLENVDGQYKINEDAVKRMIAAEKEQMAIETALSYLSNINEALGNGELNRINALVDASQKISAGTWGAVYAQAELMKNAGLTSDQYNQIIFNIDALREMAGNVITDLGNQSSNMLEEQASALDKILEYTEDLVQADAKDRVDAIKQEVSAYKDIINLRKEALKIAREDNDYEKSVVEKVSEIAKLQAQINQLSLDDSREARAQRAGLEEQLAEKQASLADYQSEHAFNALNDALDAMAEDYEAERQADIDAVEASVSSTEKIYQLALDRIRTGWGTLYDDLITWNTEQGKVINQEIIENWNMAGDAVMRYGTYLKALEDMRGLDVGESLVVAPKYHTGGEVGDATNIKSDEVLSILEKGELVVNKKAKTGLFKIIDFHKTLSERLGIGIGKIKAPSGRDANIPGVGAVGTDHPGITQNQNIVFEPEINVEINHAGDMEQNDATSFGRRIADTAIDKLYSAFDRRGVTGIYGAKLKQA